MKSVFPKISEPAYIGNLKVRHPPQSGWLDEWGRLKGGRPFYPTPGSSEILSLFDKATECISYSQIVPHPPTELKELLDSYPDVNG